MKKLCANSVFPISMSVGIGTAMGVALKDNSVGFAIGVAIFVILIIAKKAKKSKDI
jgi:hypothetical protein